MSLEWRPPGYRGGAGDGEVWNLVKTSPRWEIVGVLVYLGLTRHKNWADRLQRWRIDRTEGAYLEDSKGQEIQVNSMEEAKATALALLTLS